MDVSGRSPVDMGGGIVNPQKGRFSYIYHRVERGEHSSLWCRLLSLVGNPWCDGLYACGGSDSY